LQTSIFAPLFNRKHISLWFCLSKFESW